VDVDLRDHLHLLKGAKLSVLLAIALHSNEDGWAWPSYDTLMRETGYSEATLKKALDELCKLEIDGRRVLLRYQPQGDGGKFRSNRYLLFPSPEEIAEFEGAGITHLGAATQGGFDRRIKSIRRRIKIPPRKKYTTNQNHIIILNQNQFRRRKGKAARKQSLRDLWA